MPCRFPRFVEKLQTSVPSMSTIQTRINWPECFSVHGDNLPSIHVEATGCKSTLAMEFCLTTSWLSLDNSFFFFPPSKDGNQKGHELVDLLLRSETQVAKSHTGIYLFTQAGLVCRH